jgi:hypothetical protein
MGGFVPWSWRWAIHVLTDQSGYTNIFPIPVDSTVSGRYPSKRPDQAIVTTMVVDNFM